MIRCKFYISNGINFTFMLTILNFNSVFVSKGDEDETDGTMVKKTDQEGTMKAQPECRLNVPKCCHLLE